VVGEHSLNWVHLAGELLLVLCEYTSLRRKRATLLFGWPSPSVGRLEVQSFEIVGDGVSGR
jgi:hypothetical protein